jgi:hypothetical protein
MAKQSKMFKKENKETIKLDKDKFKKASKIPSKAKKLVDKGMTIKGKC